MDRALPAAIAPPAAAEPLRTDRLFAQAWAVIRRRWAAYLALTLIFGVGPTALACALFDLTPAGLGTAGAAVRMASMGLFVLGDAALGGALARLTLGDLAGQRPSLRQVLSFPPRLWLALLGVAAALDIPMLGLNLVSGLIAQTPAQSLALYGVRFAAGVTIGAVWCGAAAAVAGENLSAPAALARAARAMRGRRAAIGLFFAAFFILKVLGPYLLIDVCLQALAPVAPAALLTWAGVLVWNLLACSLGVATALIWVTIGRPADT